MKVIFLDFDGVLNSAASFLMEDRKRRGKGKRHRQSFCPVNETLCNVCTSNFKYLLDKVQDAKIVISSSWREYYDLDWLRAKLESYGIDPKRVIDKTPSLKVQEMYGTATYQNRSDEIGDWLDKHPEVEKFVILDDNLLGGSRFCIGVDFVKTRWNVGMTLEHALEAIRLLTGKQMGHELHLED